MDNIELKIGDTVYVGGIEFIISQVRLDRFLSGSNMMMQGVEPLLWAAEKEKIKKQKEYFEKAAAVADQCLGE